MTAWTGADDGTVAFDATLARTWRHGLVEVDGAVIGAWAVRGVGVATRPFASVTLDVVVAVRSDGGRARARTTADLPVAALDAWVASTTGDLRRDPGPGVVGPGPLGEVLSHLVETGDTVDAATGPLRVGLRVRTTLDACGFGSTSVDRVPQRWSEAARLSLGRAAEASIAFLATLDPVALDLLRAVPDRVPSGFVAWASGTLGASWADADRTFRPDAPLAMALRAHPWLWLLVLRSWVDPTAARAIREGGIERVLADGSGVPRATLRSLPGVCAAWGRLPEAERREVGVTLTRSNDPVTDVLGLLRHLPAAWRPRDEAAHDALLRCAGTLNVALCHCSPGTLARYLRMGGDWTAFLTRLRSACDDAPPEVAAADVRDLAVAYREQVLVPAHLADARPEVRARARDVALELDGVQRLLTSGRSLLRVLGTSRDWHAREAALRFAHGRVTGQGGARTWAAGCPDHREGGLVLRVLVTEGDLCLEGASGSMGGLSHCVGGYGSRCLSGRSRIGSVRRVLPDGSEARASTVELVDGGEGPPTVGQHAGPRNSRPPDDCVAFVGRYVDGLRDGTIPFEPDALRAVPQPAREAVDWLVPGR